MAIGRLHRANINTRLEALMDVGEILPAHKADIEPWLMIELNGRASGWIGQLQAAMFNTPNAAIISRLLPPLYELLDIPDRQARTLRFEQRAFISLSRTNNFTRHWMRC
jgi:hypothetical protein